MRGFLTLVGKEWRDVRWIAVASAPLVVVACLVARWVQGEYLRDVWASHRSELGPWPHWVEALVPVATAFFGAMLAADAVGGETASRRIDALALLPVGPGRVFAAKLAHLLAATALFGAYAFLVQAAVLHAWDGVEQSRAYADWTWTKLPQGAAAVCGAVLSVLLASTLGMRGLGALFVGAAIGGGLVAGHAYLPGAFLTDITARGSATVWLDARERAWVAGLVVVLPLVLAAALAYRCGRVHLGRPARRALLAGGVLVVTLAAPTAVLAREARTLTPGRGWAEVGVVEPSPDGRFVAIDVLNRAAYGVLIVDCASGAVHEVPEATLLPPIAWNPSNWEADGRLRCTGSRTVLVDPVTHAEEPAVRNAVERSREAAARLEAWRASRWTLARHAWTPADQRRRWTVHLAGPQDARAEVSGVAAFALSETGAALYSPDGDRLVLRDLATGAERTISERVGGYEGATVRLHHQGRTASVATATERFLIDLPSGRERALPSPTADVWAPAIPGAQRRLLQWTDGPDTVFLDVDTGACGRLTLRAGRPVHLVGALPGGRLVVPRGDDVVLLGPDLRVERVLLGGD